MGFNKLHAHRMPPHVRKRLERTSGQNWTPTTGSPRIFRSVAKEHPVELLHPLVPEEQFDLDVSVIFGTYNRFSTLKLCVESIRHAAKNVSYEIVICDGGSTDGTIEWLEQQPDVVLVRGDLSGAVKAFNVCFERVRGRFTVALNDDCTIFPTTLVQGMAYLLADPLVGQVALTYRENGKWLTQPVHGKVYANYAITRTTLARKIASICGGYWASCYFTYGGDTELSCWVYRLGYKVVAAPDACVDHFETKDELRSKNIRVDKARNQFFHRWYSGETMAFRGPVPRVTEPELLLLQTAEAGERPEDRWTRIAFCDPHPGQLPLTAEPTAERVLHMHLWTADDPQNSLAEAMRVLGVHGHIRIDWTSLPGEDRTRVFVEAARELKPTLIFLQLQAPGVLDASTVASIRRELHDPSLVTIAWSGDVGHNNGPWNGVNDAWSYELAKHCDLMLFTGTGQVERHRARGMVNAAYLQIGFDEDRYFPGPDDAYGTKHEAVFLGQNYGPQWNSIPNNEAGVRRELVSRFSKLPGFAVYGGGWEHGHGVAQAEVGNILRRSRLALSVSLTSDLGRYSSDRLIRAMACGTPTLVKRFADMEGLGLIDNENCIVWNTVDEAYEKAQYWLDQTRREQLRAIGRAGADLMKLRHTWGYRLRELAALVRTVRGEKLP